MGGGWDWTCVVMEGCVGVSGWVGEGGGGWVCYWVGWWMLVGVARTLMRMSECGQGRGVIKVDD